MASAASYYHKSKSEEVAKIEKSGTQNPTLGFDPSDKPTI